MTRTKPEDEGTLSEQKSEREAEEKTRSKMDQRTEAETKDANEGGLGGT